MKSSRIASSLFLLSMPVLPLIATQTPGSKPPVARAVMTTAPRAQMEALARKLGLGANRSDSPEPRATTSVKKTAGFYECFERGCVYASPSGVYAVSRALFQRYVDEGAEHKRLGFPIGNESSCSNPLGSRYQDFEGGRVVWNNGSGATAIRTVPNAADPANCEVMALPIQPESASLATPLQEARPAETPSLGIYPGTPAGPSSGRFRVTLNGFFVSHETNDHALEVDGKHDEVYIVADIAEFDATGGIASRSSLQSRVLGDIQGFEDAPARLPAGSASSLGGLKTGDNVPGDDPWRRTRTPGSSRPPLLLWEGTLTRGERGVVIVPTIWEWDGPTDVLIAYRRSMVGSLARAVRAFSINERNADLLLAPLTGGPGTERIVGFEPTGNAADRPIGMNVAAGSFLAASPDQQGREWFTPKRLLLTYDMARDAATSTTRGFGPGVVPIVYQDHADLAGNYVLYVQIEALP